MIEIRCLVWMIVFRIIAFLNWMNVRVINSNVQHFCSPNRYARCHVTRINPDKSTFLNSNLLVSNILNHLSPTPPSPPPAPDAYVSPHLFSKTKTLIGN